MPLYYRKSGSTYLINYYSDTTNWAPSLDQTHFFRVKVGGAVKYIGLINKSSGTYATTVHPQESNLRIYHGGAIYALAFRSKQIVVEQNSITIGTDWQYPVLEYKLVGGGRSSGSSGGGGGGAVAWRTHIFANYSAAAAGGGSGGGHGASTNPAMPTVWTTYTETLSVGDTYSVVAGDCVGSNTMAPNLNPVAGSENGYLEFAGTVTGGTGGTGIASQSGSTSYLYKTPNGGSQQVAKTANGDGALAQQRGTGGYTYCSDGGMKAYGGNGGYGTTAGNNGQGGAPDFAIVKSNSQDKTAWGGASALNAVNAGGRGHIHYTDDQAQGGYCLVNEYMEAGGPGQVALRVTYWSAT